MAKIELGKSFDGMLHFEGQKFYKAALILREDPVHYSNMPCWVNLAFSIELMLKSFEVEKTITTSRDSPSKINTVEVNHPLGHKLDEVFDNLSETLRETLRRLFAEQSEFDLEEILSFHSSLFEDARYLYPKRVMEGSTGFSVNEESLFSVAEFLASITVDSNGN